MKVILASNSLSRRKILESIGINFEVIPPKIREKSKENASPEEIAQELAYKKAKKVAKNVKEGIVIGADTIASLNGKVFGKPKNKHEAIEMLETLSGTRHKVITGISFIIVKKGKIIEEIKHREITWIEMKNIPSDEIRRYVEENLPLDKSGSYAIQKEDKFIKKIEGDFYNVVGFPKYKIKKTLNELFQKYGNGKKLTLSS